MCYARPVADGRRQRRSATNVERRFRAGSAIRSGARAPTCSVAGTRSTSLVPRGPAGSVSSQSLRIRRPGRLPRPPQVAVRASTTFPRPRTLHPSPHGPPSLALPQGLASRPGLRRMLTRRLREKPPRTKRQPLLLPRPRLLRRLRRRRLHPWFLRRPVLRHGDGVELPRHPRHHRRAMSQPLRRLLFRRLPRLHIARRSLRRPVAE